MTIEFIYRDDVSSLTMDDAETSAHVHVKTSAVGIETVVEAFKTFLMFAGYHEDCVNAITYEEIERQGLPSRQAASGGDQLELFPDEHEEGGI